MNVIKYIGKHRESEGVSRFNRSLGLEIYGEKLCRCFHEILELIWGR